MPYFPILISLTNQANTWQIFGQVTLKGQINSVCFLEKCSKIFPIFLSKKGLKGAKFSIQIVKFLSFSERCQMSYNWFKNYLAGRSQFVDINGYKSEPFKINILVIQGSTLGLTLFALSMTFYTLFFFKDNTTCLGIDKNLKDLTT